jgi:hypothetical protein
VAAHQRVYFVVQVKESPADFFDLQRMLASQAAAKSHLRRSLAQRMAAFLAMAAALGGTGGLIVQLFNWLLLPLEASAMVIAACASALMAFVARQERHMTAVALRARARVLTPAVFWEEITSGPKSAAFAAVLTQVLRSQFPFLGGMSVRQVAERIRRALASPEAVAPSYAHLETVLDKDFVVRGALRSISDVHGI